MLQIKYLISAIYIIVIDSIYLHLSKNWFQSQIQKIQQTPLQLNLTASLLSYVFIIFGFNYFIIQYNRSCNEAAILGLIIYAIYEFTNMAIFTKWSIFTVLMDTLWGAILFWLTCLSTYYTIGIFRIK